MHANPNPRSVLRAVSAASVIAALSIGLTACGGGDTTTNAAGAASDGPSETASGSGGGIKGKTIALVSCGDVNPWCKIYNHTIIDALEKDGANVKYLQDPFDATVQVQNLNSAIGQKPDALLLVATDDNSVVPSLARAKQANLPTFLLNGRPADAAMPLMTATIQVNNTQLGEYAAENIVEGLRKQGRKSGNVMVIQGTAASNTVKDRMAAFTKTMAKYPEYKVVATEDGNWDQVLTAKLAQQIFAKYRNKGGIAAAYGMADYMAAGILQAAKQADLPIGVDKPNGLIVTGSNCFKVGIDAIKKGEQYGTGTQAPSVEGDFVVKKIREYFDTGKLAKESFNEEARITPDNVEEYAEVCSKA